MIVCFKKKWALKKKSNLNSPIINVNFLISVGQNSKNNNKLQQIHTP